MDGNAVNQSTLKQVAVPAAAAAVVVLLIGVLVATSDWNAKPTATSGAPPGAASGRSADQSAAGMSDGMPPLDDPGWKELSEGVKVWDAVDGAGDPVPAGAKVTTHYAGWLTSGKKFNDSRDEGKPIDFSLNGVVRGWMVGIPGMKVGGIRRLLIPPELAYGAEGRPGIPKNATLVFEIKLLGFTS